MSRTGDEIRAARSADRQRLIDRRLASGTMRGTLANASWATRRLLPSMQATIPFSSAGGGSCPVSYGLSGFVTDQLTVEDQDENDEHVILPQNLSPLAISEVELPHEWNRVKIHYSFRWFVASEDEWFELWVAPAIWGYDGGSNDGLFTDSIGTHYMRGRSRDDDHFDRDLETNGHFIQDLPAGTWQFGYWFAGGLVICPTSLSVVELRWRQIWVEVCGPPPEFPQWFNLEPWP